MIKLYPERNARREVRACDTVCLGAGVARRIDFSIERVALTIGRHEPVPDLPANVTASVPEEPARGDTRGNGGSSVARVVAIAEVDGLRHLRGSAARSSGAAGAAGDPACSHVGSAAASPCVRRGSAIGRASVALLVAA
jgi:hypothetical protein